MIVFVVMCVHACTGLDCGIFMLANIMAIVTGHQSCNEIDPTRVREWLMEELYLDGMRTGKCAPHSHGRLLDVNTRPSLFGLRVFQDF